MKRYWPIGVITAIWLVLVLVNFRPGTWLSGWDNLHPEFNFGLNFSRAIQAAWQEYQGLGLPGGMAHAADLPRIVILAALSLVFPLQALRYMWMFMMLWWGTLGAYVLGKQLIPHKKQDSQWPSLVMGLFYLLNLATVQYFYPPLETFGSFFGFFPWLLWAVLSFWKKPAKKTGLILLVLGFVASPAFYVQTLFISLFLVLGIFAVFHLIATRLKAFRVVIISLALLVVGNLYWLLPAGYFSVNHGSTVGEAKINSIATPETVLMNQARGSIADIVLLRGYWLDYLDVGGDLEFTYLMTDWRNYSSNRWVELVGVVIFCVAVMGLIIALKQKIQWSGAGVALLAVSFIMLSGGWLFVWFSETIPLFGESFRSVFTKWSPVTALTYGWGLGLFCWWFSRKQALLARFLGPMLIGGFILVVFPLFQGKLFYSALRGNIPSEYFSLFTYLNTQSEQQRVVYLPFTEFWGWHYYSWGYRGSGFLWYGVKQPILDRAFDVWSPYNETFYNELSTAFYMCPSDPDEGQLTKCARNVAQVFQKYQVSLALLDESVILPGQDEEIMRYELWKRVLAKLDPAVDFERGFLSVYTVGEATTGISAPESYRAIATDTTYGRFDPYYSNRAAYVDGGQAQFPFASLSKEDLSQEVDYAEDGTVAIMGEEVAGGMVVFPAFSKGDMWQGRLRATLSGEALSVELLPFGELVMGEQRFPLWLDQRLEVVEIPSALESVVIQVGNTTKRIVRDTPDELWDVPMVAGERLVVRVFEGEGQTVKASIASVRLGQLPPDRLIQVIGEGRVCLGHEQTDYQCLNQGPLLVTPRAGVYWLDMLEKVDTFPEVKIFQLVANYEFPTKMWETAKREFSLEIRDKRYEIRWEQASSGLELGSKKKEEGDRNCDVLKRGSAKKSVVEGVALYEATNYGAYCDSWWVEPIVGEGVVRVLGENIEGRGIKLGLFSTNENRTLLEHLLPSGGTFDQSYGFLTGLSNGSTITVETKAFGRIAGENRLDSVRFYPVPLTWLQKIKIGSDALVDNQLQILDTKKWGTGIYRVTVEGSGLLVLNQGFYEGWISPGLEHIRVNGWSNGFIVDEAGSRKKEERSKNQSIIIFFWPQVLQWVGFGLLVGTGVVVGRKSRGFD